MVLYGHEPRHFGVDISQSCQQSDLQNWLEERELMQELVRQHLIRAQHKMKNQADKRRSNRVFQVGQQVYLKAQPYVQTSLAPRSSNKLAFRFFGPFSIIERIGQSTYRLKLADGCLIHPVFHISQLKTAVPPSTPVSSIIPDATNELQGTHRYPRSSPASVQRHYDASSAGPLVRWSDPPSALDTWEDEAPLRLQFPRSPALGQAGFQDRGDVTVARPPTSATASEEPEGGAGMKEVEAGWAERSKRTKKVNTQYMGQTG